MEVIAVGGEPTVPGIVKDFASRCSQPVTWQLMLNAKREAGVVTTKSHLF